jgi:ABC-2 type transport system permease protein
MVNWKNRKLEHALLLLASVAAVVFVNLLVERYTYRIDLTEEKRYTISPATKSLLQNLEDVVYVEVYLEGELPAGFKRFQNATRELLEQFAYYGGSNFQFSFVNPDAGKSDKSKNEFYKYLSEKGIQPTNLTYKQDGGKTEKLIFPGALITYFDQEAPVLLLKGNKSASPDEIINQSIENLEYEFVSAVQKLAEDQRKSIGIIKGHGELDSLQVAGFTALLMEKYDVFQVNLKARNTPISDYDVLVIAKPTSEFTELEKYKIDQYVMQGGNLIVFLDALAVNMEEASGDGTFAFPYETNLSDLLFKYGVRINQNYIKDINCGFFPVVAGNMGDQAQIRMLPWPFFPLINAYGNHQIVRNLDASIMKFASNIDTVKAVGITKTPLMMSSPYTRIVGTPVKVSFNDLQKELNPSLYQNGPQVVSYLLEGNFTSLYKGRLLPAGIDASNFLDSGKPAKIIVVSDGDFIRNDIDKGLPQDLGYDPMQKVMYGNKDFVNNALTYLTDKDGIINTRLKEIAIRPLDKVKVENERTYWQVFNLASPLIVFLLFGLIRGYIRKRKYANHG